MRLRFNQLPDVDIIRFLSIISQKENLTISKDTLTSIQRLYKSDIRSMINYMQSNQHSMQEQKVIDNNVWNTLTQSIKNSRIDDSIRMIQTISSTYNIEIKNIIKDYLNFIIRHHPEYITSKFLKFAEFIMHLKESNTDYITKYTIISLHDLLNN